MHDIHFFYDPISPYAHLAFERLPQALMGHSVAVHHRQQSLPIVFGLQKKLVLALCKWQKTA